MGHSFVMKNQNQRKYFQVNKYKQYKFISISMVSVFGKLKRVVPFLAYDN